MKVLAYQAGPLGRVKVEVFADHDYTGLLSRLHELAQAIREMALLDQGEASALALVQQNILDSLVFENGGFISVTKHSINV